MNIRNSTVKSAGERLGSTIWMQISALPVPPFIVEQLENVSNTDANLIKSARLTEDTIFVELADLLNVSN